MFEKRSSSFKITRKSAHRALDLLALLALLALLSLFALLALLALLVSLVLFASLEFEVIFALNT